MKICPKCNWQNADTASACAQCFADLDAQAAPNAVPPVQEPPGYAQVGAAGNTSGMGSTAAVPQEIMGWNWGAFFLSWIWSIGNSVWIGLLSLVPCLGFIMVIVLGVKGSEWAWQY